MIIKALCLFFMFHISIEDVHLAYPMKKTHKIVVRLEFFLTFYKTLLFKRFAEPIHHRIPTQMASGAAFPIPC